MPCASVMVHEYMRVEALCLSTVTWIVSGVTSRKDSWQTAGLGALGQVKWVVVARFPNAYAGPPAVAALMAAPSVTAASDIMRGEVRWCDMGLPPRCPVAVRCDPSARSARWPRNGFIEPCATGTVHERLPETSV